MKDFSSAHIAVGLLALVCFFCTGCSNTHGPSSLELPPDFSVVYHMSAGSVGPPYWYSLDVSADASSGVGEATIETFDQVDPLSLTVAFTADEDSLLTVLHQMVESRFFRPSWDLVACPDGAGRCRVEVRAHGARRCVPPAGSSACVADRESLEEVCDAIWFSVPVAVRDSLMTARENWIAEWHEDR